MAANYRDCAKSLGIGDEVEQYLGGNLDVDDAVFRANLEQKTHEAMRNAYVRKLEVYHRKQYQDFAAAYRTAVKGKESEHRAAVAYLSQDDAETGRVSVEQQVETVEQHYLQKINATMREIDNRSLINRVFERGHIVDDKFGEDIVRELMVLDGSGKARSTGNAEAAAVARVVAGVAEEIRVQFNRAGGFVRKLPDWALPQKHSKAKMAQNKNEWVKFTADRLDLKRMGLTKTEAEDMLAGRDGSPGVYETIMTDGASKHARDHLPTISAGKVANRYGDARKLHFKDAESWIQYQKKFGEEDYVGSMVEHIKNMSRDLGMIRAMGPNPQGLFNDMLNRVHHEHKMAQATTGKLPSFKGTDNLQAVWSNINGMAAVSEGLTRTMGGIRNIMSAAKLGGAVLSSIPDLASQAITVFFNGTGQGRWAKAWLRQMTPWLAGESKARAQRLSLMLDQVLIDFVDSARFADNEVTSFARGLSNGVYKASLLTAWDRANRTAVKLSMVEALSSAGPKIDKMNPRMQRLLKQYGITQEDWTKFRLARDPAEAGLINPSKMPLDQYQKFMGMINSETNIAVVKPSARTRAITNQGLAPGTPGGETVRMISQWKTFPIAYFQTHMTRMAAVFAGRHGDDVGVRMAYIGQYLTTAIGLGMMSIQIKEFAKGRTPVVPEDPKDWAVFVGAAAAQAGIGGLFYEAVFGALANGRSPATVLTAPVLSLFDDLLLRGLYANDDDVSDIDAQIDNLLGAPAVRALGWVPGQSIWYLRAAWDQMLIPAVADQISESEYERWKRRNRRLKRERGQETFISY